MKKHLNNAYNKIEQLYKLICKIKLIILKIVQEKYSKYMLIERMSLFQPGHGDVVRGCPACNCTTYAGAVASSPCDSVTGQCVCQPGVYGLQCDTCSVGYWRYSEWGCTGQIQQYRIVLDATPLLNLGWNKLLDKTSVLMHKKS